MDAPLAFEVELLWRQRLPYFLRHVDRCELLAEHLLDVPGGYERLIDGNEDAVFLRGEEGTMFSASVGVSRRILRLEAELRWKLLRVSCERKPLVMVDFRSASRSG
jgi:hypothetical protein